MEIKIEKPTKYANSYDFERDTGYAFIQRGNDHFLIGDATEAELLAAFAAHNPTSPAEPTVNEKLASVGLSIDDLKVALGI